MVINKIREERTSAMITRERNDHRGNVVKHQRRLTQL